MSWAPDTLTARQREHYALDMDTASNSVPKKALGEKKRAREWDTGADVVAGDPATATAEKNEEKTDDGEVEEQKQHKYRKRKSLQEQLQNRRQYLYRERRRNMEKQNSSYKMRKDTRQFYGALAEEKLQKKRTEQQQYEQELEEFRRRRAEESSGSDSNSNSDGNSDTGSDEEEKDGGKPDVERVSQTTSPATLLVGYSDSSSDSDGGDSE